MLDKNGFKRMRYADIFSEMANKAKELFGEKINVSERSPVGIILAIFAWFASKIYELMENVYHASYIDSSEGNNLDKLGKSSGVIRIQAQQAEGEITIRGTPDFLIESGFVVATEKDVFFETTDEIQLNGQGEGCGKIIAMETGVIGNVSSEEISVIVNPEPNIEMVTNQMDTSGGRAKETDYEFRERFALSRAGGGSATVGAIQSELLRTEGVRAAKVIENVKNEIDEDGRPPKSFEAFVLGGKPIDIGNSIFRKKAAGIEAFGREAVTVYDIGGHERVVRFSYAVERQVWVKVLIKKDDKFQSNGEEQLKNAVVKYIGGEGTDGTIWVGLSMGEKVSYSKLIAQLYKVDGVDDITIQISCDGETYATENIIISLFEVAQTSHERVGVSYD